MSQYFRLTGLKKGTFVTKVDVLSFRFYICHISTLFGEQFFSLIKRHKCAFKEGELKNVMEKP